MNRAFAQILIFVVLFAMGVFQIALGVGRIRSCRENTLLGWLRIALGILLAFVVPAGIWWFLQKSAGE